MLAACRDLKESGYRIALDDFVDDPKFEPLIDLADIIKVDLRITDSEQCARLAERFLPRGLTLLAEKVETWEEQREAAALGYSLSQGYFFCRPETLTGKAIRPSSLGYLRLLEEVSRPEVDIRRVERLLDAQCAAGPQPLVLSQFGPIRSHESGIVAAARRPAVGAAEVAALGQPDGRAGHVRRQTDRAIPHLHCASALLRIGGPTGGPALPAVRVVPRRPLGVGGCPPGAADGHRSATVLRPRRRAPPCWTAAANSARFATWCGPMSWPNGPRSRSALSALRIPEADLSAAYQLALSWATDTQTLMHANEP